MNKDKYRKRNEERGSFENRGSLLIAVMIVFLIISLIALAIIQRSMQGAILASDSRKGYASYQGSDAITEGFLSSLRALDNENTPGNRIPENTLYSSLCNVTGVTCLNNAATPVPLITGRVVDIFNLKAVNTATAGVTRAIQAPVPDRIDGKLNAGSLTVKNCDGSADCLMPSTTLNSYNKCDISVKVASTFDAATMLNYEVRKSIDPDLKKDPASMSDTYGWRRVPQSLTPLPIGVQFFNNNAATLIKNGDTILTNGNSGATTGGQYSVGNYYFAIKARNKKPFSLDSLYLADDVNDKVSISGTKDCTGSDALSNLVNASGVPSGCVTKAVADQTPGIEPFRSPYNCCNGTECYHPITGWVPIPGLNCSIQTCGSKLAGYTGTSGSDPQAAPIVDEATTTTGILDVGDHGISTGIGWCNTTNACVPGNLCTHPFRVVGYCVTCPDDSAKEAGIAVTAWAKKNNIDVDMNPSSYNGKTLTPFLNSKPRCCGHECPPVGAVVANPPTGYCGPLPSRGDHWIASGTTCTAAVCGDYSLAKKCNLYCSTSGNGFTAINPNPPEYPLGTCCEGICPGTAATHYNETCPSNPTHGTFTNATTCDKRCATSATDDGYTVHKVCSLNCNGWRNEGPVSADFPNGTYCTEQCAAADSSCSPLACGTKTCQENPGTYHTHPVDNCYAYPACSAASYPTCTCGFLVTPTCSVLSCGPPATANWGYTCNTDPSCSSDSVKCPAGYGVSSGSCNDWGCSITDTRICRGTPTCTYSFSKPTYTKTENIYATWNSWNAIYLWGQCEKSDGTVYPGNWVTPLSATSYNLGPMATIGIYKCKISPYAPSSSDKLGTPCSTNWITITN